MYLEAPFIVSLLLLIFYSSSLFAINFFQNKSYKFTSFSGSTKQLVPFLKSLGLPCPSYHNPASFIIEVSCGEYGDHIKKLVNAISNGKNDIRTETSFPAITGGEGLNNASKTVNDNFGESQAAEKSVNETANQVEKFADSRSNPNGSLLLNNAMNDIAKDKQSK